RHLQTAVLAAALAGLSAPSHAKPQPKPKQQQACPAICRAGVGAPTDPLPDDLSEVRKNILNIAAGYLGKVTDCPSVNGEKTGADVLEQIYKDSGSRGWENRFRSSGPVKK